MRLIHGILARLFPPEPEPLRELRLGIVTTVRGRVVPRDLIESPLTGERCVYYQYTVEDWRRSQVLGVGGDGFWELREKDEAIVEFYLHDDGMRAIVCPQSAKVERARGIEAIDIDLGMMNRRAQQLLIMPGDLVEILAVAERVDDLHDEGRDYRTAPTRVMLRAPEGADLIIRIIERHRDGRGRPSAP